MAHITVNLTELLDHCNEWLDLDTVELCIDEDTNTLEIYGIEEGGLIVSDLDQIKGIN